MAADGFRDAWPAEPKSLFVNEPITNQLGPSGKTSTFTNAQGLRLASYFWPAAKPKAVVMLLHGNGAYVMEFLATQVIALPQDAKFRFNMALQSSTLYLVCR